MIVHICTLLVRPSWISPGGGPEGGQSDGTGPTGIRDTEEVHLEVGDAVSIPG